MPKATVRTKSRYRELRVPLLSVLLPLALACSQSPASPSEDEILELVEISPAVVELDQGSSVQFTASLQDEHGADVSDEVLWIATGGSVTVRGLYTASSSPGKHKVIARTRRGRSDTAHVEIRQRKRDRQTNAPPDADFESSCTELSCAFDNQSTDSNGNVVSSEWNFGDNSGSSTESPEHEFAAAGQYTVTLEGIDNEGASASVSRTVSVTLEPPSNAPPEADFESSCTELSCSFDNRSTDSDGNIVSSRWDFGDNASSSSNSPEHTFAAAGQYTVTLEVTDNEGASASVSRTVDVTRAPPPNSPPEASFQSSCTDLTCSFDNTGSDSDGSIVSSRWDFGDGSISWSANPQHTYGASGQYTVTLEVTDDYGASSSDSRTVEVTSPPPPPPSLDYDVAIGPGESIQGVVDANPAGTVYLIKAGVHRRQSIKPKTGDKFIGEDGAVLDGENTTKYAFEGYSSARDVEIRNLIVERYVPDTQQGAVRAGYYWDWPEFNAPGWTIAECEIRYNSAGGISTAPQIVIVGNRIHHNGQAGILGYGNGILIEDNEISHNNYENAFDTWWEAGGMKLKRTRDLVVRGNHVHHNTGRGIWTDIDNVNVLIEDNLVEDNTLAGIFHEISYDAVIRNNTVLRNALSDPNAESWLWGSGILVSNSRNVEVTGNHVEGNANGIGAIEQNRGSGAYGAYLVENLKVHDNTVIMDRGWTGIVQDTGDRSVFRNRGNHFDRNTYHLQGGSRRFRWEANQRTEEEWRAYGNDANGSFSY